MPLKILIIQHCAWENPGKNLKKSLHELEINFDVVRIYQHAAPDPAGYDALILLGGPPNVNEEDKYPFLKEEKRFIKAWLKMDKPLMGFCLGHQLLASILGAEIGKNFTPSVGFIRGHLTKAGQEHPVFRNMNHSKTLFKWHGQAITTPMPKDLIMLETSRECVVEAFSLVDRPHIIGLQYDNHAAHVEDAKIWIEQDKSWLEETGFGRQKENIIKLAEERANELETTFKQIITNFKQIITT